MNINCIICTDFLAPSAEIYVTQCGHIFHFHCLINWVETKRTCPQCRQKVTEKNIHKIYLNVTDAENIENAINLQSRVEALELELSTKDKDVDAYKSKYKDTKSQLTSYREVIINYQKKVEEDETAIRALKDQVTFLRKKNKDCEKTAEDVVKLKNKLKELEFVQIAMSSTQNKVNELIRNQTSKESLALLAATLEKTLSETKSQKLTVDYKYKAIQCEVAKLKKDNTSIEQAYQDLKQNFEEEKSNWNLEKARMRNKIEELTLSLAINKSGKSVVDVSLERILTESPVPVPRKNPKSDDLRVVYKSPSLPQKIQHILESKSPYLNLKSSGIVENSVLNKNMHSRNPNVVLLKREGVCYDGLGGHSKDDFFPSSKKSLTGKRPATTVTTAKFKRLAPIKKPKIVN